MKKAMLSEEQKIFILTNYDKKSLGKLSQDLNRSRQTIYSFLRKWRATKTILNRKHLCGRKSYLTPAQIKRIENFVGKNPKSSVRDIRKSLKLKCSDFPVQKSLKKLGFKNLVFRHKPILSETDRLKRLIFAKKYKAWTIRDWKKVLFTDETSIQVGKKYPRKIWLKPENRLKPGYFLPKKQDYGKKYIKAWSCLSYKGVGELHFIENGWNSHVNKNILDSRLILEAERLIGKDFIFQEDGDKVHTSKVPSTWKKKNNINVLYWPSSSCDLSPLENLWGDFKRRLGEEIQSSNIEEFKLQAQRVWRETKVSLCETLIGSVPRRIRAMLENNGGINKY